MRTDIAMVVDKIAGGKRGQRAAIATGSGIRERSRLVKRYGRGRWRKRKGLADIKLGGGDVVRAELHWYEATGLGKFEFKIKRFV